MTHLLSAPCHISVLQLQIQIVSQQSKVQGQVSDSCEVRDPLGSFARMARNVCMLAVPILL